MGTPATIRNRNLLKLFGRAPAGQNTPFSMLPLTVLQVRNGPRAPTTQTRHPGHALVQWASCANHLIHSNSSRADFLNFHARRVRRGDHQTTLHDTNADTCTSQYTIRQKHVHRAASAGTRGRAAAASLPVPKPPRTTARGHPSRHGTTCPHAAAQTLPEAVAQTRALPAAPQLPIRRHRIVLPRGRPAKHGCKLVC